MRVSLDLVIAFGTAVGLHGVLLQWHETSGASGAGASGRNAVSVAAVSPAAARLVETWTKPVEAQENAPGRLRSPDPSAAVGALPTTDATRSSRALSGLPRLDTSAAPAKPATSALAGLVPPAPSSTVNLQNPALGAETPVQPSTPDRVIAQVAPSDALPVLDRLPAAPDNAPKVAERPKPKPKQSSAPVVTRKIAAGEKLGTRRGAAKVDTGASVTTAERQTAQSAWAAQIQQRIARHQSYPKGARGDGRVKVSMVIRANGQLGQVSIITSSGAEKLDKAALSAVRKAAPFPPAPKVLNEPYFTVGQWIRFERR